MLSYSDKHPVDGASGDSYHDVNSEAIPSAVGDLSAYRAGMDTDKQALWGPFGIFNQITSLLCNFFINVGAIYASGSNKSWVGVWSQPPVPNSFGLPMWADWLLTSILVVFGMGLLATPGQWASIWIGQARPVPGKYTTGANAWWYWRVFTPAFKPKGAKLFLVRSLLMVACYSAPFYGVAMLITFGMCKSYNIFAGPGASVGADPGRGHDPQCWIDPIIYIWVRAACFTVLGIPVYPAAYVAALDVENVPAWALRRWMTAMEKKGLVSKPAAASTASDGITPTHNTSSYYGVNGHSTDRDDSLA